MPFQIFDDSEFFKTIISSYEEIFNINLNSRNIVKVLESSSIKTREIIKTRIINQMVSLKIDIATRMDRNILGVDIQDIHDFKNFINTLGNAKN